MPDDRLEKGGSGPTSKTAAILYNLVVFLTLPLAAAYLGIQWVLYKRYRESLRPRLGMLPPDLNRNGSRGPVFWIHAVSVGEVMAVTPLVKRLRQHYPEARLLVSTVTETGQATARARLPEADQFFYFPFDLPWMVRKVISSIKPSLFIFVETEIWPNFLFALAQKGIPAAMVNGRISGRSFRGYKLLAPFFKTVLKGVSLFSVQTDLDRERLIAIGADPRRVVRTGNMKYDQAAIEIPSGREEIRRSLRLGGSSDLIVAGSTHEGEEEPLLRCYLELLRNHGEARLLLAPRHLDRLERIERVIQRLGLTTVRRTKVESCGFSEVPPDTILLLDTLGELQSLYAVASLVFVGGSLVPIGGHNVLEPAACARPVLFGPHMENFTEIARLLVERQGAIQIVDEKQLLRVMQQLLADREWSDRMGRQARQAVMEQQGVVERNLQLLQGLLEH